MLAIRLQGLRTSSLEHRTHVFYTARKEQLPRLPQRLICESDVVFVCELNGHMTQSRRDGERSTNKRLRDILGSRPGQTTSI